MDPNVTEEELKQTFLQFGDIGYVKIPAGKGCGFVQFGTRFDICLHMIPLLEFADTLNGGGETFPVLFLFVSLRLPSFSKASVFVLGC